MQHVGLQPARYIEAAAYRTISRYRDMKRHDISISLLGYDMITSIDKRKGKERKSIYIAPFRTKVHTKRSGMDHTVLPANNTMPAFPSWHSPNVNTTATEAAEHPIAAHYSFIDPKRMKG